MASFSMLLQRIYNILLHHALPFVAAVCVFVYVCVWWGVWGISERQCKHF